jgi:acyl-CoA dehydrogenase
MRDLLEQSVERLLTSEINPDLLGRTDADGAWAAELWRMMEEAGFTVALVPEAAGGAGARWPDVFALFRAVGRYAAPIPFAEAALANWLLAEAGLPIPQGATTIARADLTVLNGRVSGRLLGAPWGRHARQILAVSPGSEPMVMLFDRAELTVSHGLNLAREPQDDFVMEDVAPLAAAPLPDQLPADVLLRGGALARSAQIAGALQHALDLSLRYAEERSQFGKPIGKFQAVQQQLAVLAEHALLSSTAAEAAFAADGNFSELPIASAKIVAGQSAAAGAAIAHAVHGAIGVTFEHSLHFTTRRLWAWRSEFGSDRYWSERLGRLISVQPAGQFWPRLSTPFTLSPFI